MEKAQSKVDRILFYAALILIIYMPLHVFIVQSLSLVTGGIEFWKAAKDVILVLFAPVMLYLSYARGLFANKWFRRFIVAGGAYTLLHMLFVLLDSSDHTYSAIVGSVYNTRILGYMLLGILVGSAKQSKKYIKALLTAAVLVAFVVSVFGVLQYFLPPDFLERFGYTLERGVKPLFFIDDKPDLPRVMSTLKDPNSFGAYLILPILMTAWAWINNKVNKELFIRPFKKSWLAAMSLTMFIALMFTFSRGAAIGLVLAVLTILLLTKGKIVINSLRRYWVYGLISFALVFGFVFVARDTYVVQNVIFHADESTVLDDPNEKRLKLYQQSIEVISEKPLGHGPGSAGLVSINNPQGGVLNENYYLQIAHEVGWLGLALFVYILWIVFRGLYKNSKDNYLATILVGSMAAYLFYSLLIHLWSNEAVALQWWLITGLCFGSLIHRNKIHY